MIQKINHDWCVAKLPIQDTVFNLLNFILIILLSENTLKSEANEENENNNNYLYEHGAYLKWFPFYEIKHFIIKK